MVGATRVGGAGGVGRAAGLCGVEPGVVVAGIGGVTVRCISGAVVGGVTDVDRAKNKEGECASSSTEGKKAGNWHLLSPLRGAAGVGGTAVQHPGGGRPGGAVRRGLENSLTRRMAQKLSI